ncbi:hypothetical protein EUA93_01655 [Nocardioides oleivorans]|uniref:Uncharacterized protein n=1 Tax=Nocardioides oleivorans TaxID=273676 RepID=A0A4Q2RZN9_9ACTN|nr:hypothetical protein [Nocardioides oleivorans]RYB93173.1 hypothetical protein EUA93_01655 [Nocardioides oleivorans]
MTGPRGDEVGANLAELYKKGRDVMPPIASDVDLARDKAWMITVSDELRRDSRLGLGATGPSDAFHTMEAALNRRMSAVVEQLEAIGINIMKTAQDMATVDQETRDAFVRDGGQLA